MIRGHEFDIKQQHGNLIVSCDCGEWEKTLNPGMTLRELNHACMLHRVEVLLKNPLFMTGTNTFTPEDLKAWNVTSPADEFLDTRYVEGETGHG